MKRPLRDPNRVVAKQVAKVTKTPPPKGEDLLGSEELKRKLTAARERIRKL